MANPAATPPASARASQYSARSSIARPNARGNGSPTSPSLPPVTSTQPLASRAIMPPNASVPMANATPLSRPSIAPMAAPSTRPAASPAAMPANTDSVTFNATQAAAYAPPPNSAAWPNDTRPSWPMTRPKLIAQTA